MLTRREWLKAGVVGAAAGSVRLGAQTLPEPTDVVTSTCPSTPAFAAALPRPDDPRQKDELDPGPVPARHQHYPEYAPKKFFEMRVREFGHKFHPNLDNSSVWGYDGKLPGPTFKARYGEPMMVRIHNDLPADHTGFGIPEISTHLHNLHTASESDGFPGDFYGPGKYRDHHYCCTLAGDDPCEALGTLWYHDHRFDFTAQNVYRGLAGFYLIYDDLDTGDERTGLQLPSGEFDVPLALSDISLDQNSQLIFPFFNLDGFLGDKFTVNGAIQPYMKVARRKYRFRFLDSSLSRFYELGLSSKQNMAIIASDGNLLPVPVWRQTFRIGPAERMDVIIDFSKYNRGDKVYLVNRLEQTNGRKPGNLRSTGPQIMRFDIDRDEADYSVVPARMRALPPIDMSEVKAQRTWVFGRRQGVWTVNDKIFNVNEVRARIKQNTAEIWTLRNDSGGWAHPIHIHFEEFQILSRNGKPAPPWEGRKDVVVLNPNETVKIFMRFRGFLGRYPMHCHNLVHEDHAMMIRWDIVP